MGDLAGAIDGLAQLVDGAREEVIARVVEEELVVEGGAGLGEGDDGDADG